jgi:hypothetical protein
MYVQEVLCFLPLEKVMILQSHFLLVQTLGIIFRLCIISLYVYKTSGSARFPNGSF